MMYKLKLSVCEVVVKNKTGIRFKYRKTVAATSTEILNP